ISIPCPFPSYQPKEKLYLLAKEQPLLAHKKLVNESLLINRIALALIGTFACNLLTHQGIYASAVLLVGGSVSLPSLILGTSSYFLCQGVSSIALTKDMSNVFQNVLLGGLEIVTALSMMYFYDAKPIGLIEPTLQKIADSSILEKEKTILFS
ncbi:MAG: hypothetical protein V4489_06625, partial [Chlamydiota bacterium]